MQNRKLRIIIVISLLFSVALLIPFAKAGSSESRDVLFRIKADRDSLLLGEIIHLGFEFVNTGETDVEIPTGGVMSGNTQIYLAREGEDFRRYITSGWGRSPEKIVVLKSNQSYNVDNTNAKVLWNSKPNYSHLNQDSAESADKVDNRVLTDYAFSEAGTYLLKAVTCLVDGLNGCSIPIESNAIRITVNEPVGKDLEVWERMRRNPKLGLFLQTNGSSLKEKDNAVAEELRKLIETYPDSTYAESMKKSLEKFNSNVQKRKAYLEKTMP